MGVIVKKKIKKLVRNLGFHVYRAEKDDDRLRLSRLRGEHDCLVAGPFLGEFGWELMQWQGYVRQLSRFYDKTIVYGRGSSEFFYRDFASEFRETEVDSWDTTAYVLNGFDYAGWAQQFKDVDILVADERTGYELPLLFNQDFIPFGKPDKEKAYDVVVHARSIPDLGGNRKKKTRNWSTDNWDALCASLAGLKVAAVGIPELSYAPPGVVDLRGLDTGQVCSVLASSRCCIGPSSGLMHLASLCRTPHLVWMSPRAGGRFGGTLYRYLRTWNPLATPVKVLTEMGWHPSPEYVREELHGFLDAGGE